MKGFQLLALGISTLAPLAACAPSAEVSASGFAPAPPRPIPPQVASGGTALLLETQDGIPVVKALIEGVDVRLEVRPAYAGDILLRDHVFMDPRAVPVGMGEVRRAVRDRRPGDEVRVRVPGMTLGDAIVADFDVHVPSRKAAEIVFHQRGMADGWLGVGVLGRFRHRVDPTGPWLVLEPITPAAPPGLPPVPVH